MKSCSDTFPGSTQVERFNETFVTAQETFPGSKVETGGCAGRHKQVTCNLGVSCCGLLPEHSNIVPSSFFFQCRR